MPLESKTEQTEPAFGLGLLTGRIRSGVIILAVLCLGIFIGRSMPGTLSAEAAHSTAEGTATFSAEPEELNELRTKVAQPSACTPAPTETPTATPTPTPTATTVPAQPTGAKVVDANGWAVTVLSVQPVPAPVGVDASGQLMRLNVSIRNTSSSPMLPPFVDWQLVDAAGNRYPVDLDATPLVAGVAWGVAIGGHQTEDRAVVFEVSGDAGTTFVLENEKDPTFRVEVRIEARG